MSKKFHLLIGLFFGLLLLAACAVRDAMPTATPTRPLAREGLQFVEFYSPF